MTLTRPIRAVMTAAALSLAVAGCARQISPNVVDGAAVGETIRTEPGVVEMVRVVEVQEGDRLQENTTGAAVGGLAGGAAASRIGQGWGKVAAIGAGAIAGAALGAVAEREITRQQALEYTVRLDNGQRVTVVQGGDSAIPSGSRVFVQFSNRGRSRVVPA